MIKNYKDLIVWQKSMYLTEKVYNLTKFLPTNESNNIISQIKRSSVSISSNIAEGFSKGSRNHYRQHLKISYASAAELESQLELIKRLALISQIDFLNEINNLLVEILKMLSKMIKNIS